MPLKRAVRAVLSALCWTLATIAGLLTAGTFGGSGVLCEWDQRQCPPRTLVLVLGVLLTLAFGAAGAMLYKPKPKTTPRRPWEYDR